MAYTDFSPDAVAAILGFTPEVADLFPGLTPVPVPGWLVDHLERGHQAASLLSEKARSEFLVVPILLAARDLVAGPVAIYSGQRLDVDPDRGLVGECDFLLTASQPVPALRPPVLVVVEAKRHDIEAGVWQCLAQMAGAQVFNERAGRGGRPVYGCVTNGEAWQFLRSDRAAVGIDSRRYYVNAVGEILAVLQTILGPASPPA